MSPEIEYDRGIDNWKVFFKTAYFTPNKPKSYMGTLKKISRYAEFHSYCFGANADKIRYFDLLRDLPEMKITTYKKIFTDKKYNKRKEGALRALSMVYRCVKRDFIDEDNFENLLGAIKTVEIEDESLTLGDLISNFNPPAIHISNRAI